MADELPEEFRLTRFEKKFGRKPNHEEEIP